MVVEKWVEHASLSKALHQRGGLEARVSTRPARWAQRIACVPPPPVEARRGARAAPRKSSQVNGQQQQQQQVNGRLPKCVCESGQSKDNSLELAAPRKHTYVCKHTYI
jgi:hypothetical protein